MEPGLSVTVLRELFRQYWAFKALYEAEGIDTIDGPEGTSYSLWDIEYLLEQTKHLSVRQSQSIHLFLIQNMRERDVAIAMGVSEENPVASYATHGLRKIIQMVESGSLPRFRANRSDDDGSDPLRNSSAARGRSDSPDQGVSRGSYFDVSEVGHLDTLERAGSQVAGSVQQGGSAGRRSETWHVSPGVQSPVPSPELSPERPSPGTQRPPHFRPPKVERTRRDERTRGDGV